MYKAERKTAYLGDEFSYSHAAAVRLAGGQLVAFPTMTEAIAAVGHECDCAVVPAENNVEGAVNEVYDALFDCGLFIVRQLVLPVRHSLIAEEGAGISGITRVMSHPQAIAQCRKYLSSLGVEVMAAQSTSAALKQACGSTAAIAFAPRPGQCVLASGIQDSELNATRFVLLSAEPADSGGKASIVFDLRDRPGALYDILGVIRRRDINLTRILSRPHRSGDGKYRFFADFDFAGSNLELDDVLSELRRECEDFRFLGRYE